MDFYSKCNFEAFMKGRVIIATFERMRVFLKQKEKFRGLFVIKPKKDALYIVQ